MKTTKLHLGTGTETSSTNTSSPGKAVLITFASVAVVSLSGCMDESAKLSAVVDPLHGQIEKRDQELDSLRSSESQLKSKIAGLESQVTSLQLELGKKEEEMSKLTKAVEGLSGLPEKLEPMIAKTVSEALKDLPMPVASATPDTGGGNRTTGNTSNTGNTGANGPLEGAGRSGEGVRKVEPGRERRTFNFE